MEWGGVAPLLLDEVDIMHATGFFQLLERTRVDKKTNNWSVDLMYIYICVFFWDNFWNFGFVELALRHSMPPISKQENLSTIFNPDVTCCFVIWDVLISCSASWTSGLLINYDRAGRLDHQLRDMRCEW